MIAGSRTLAEDIHLFLRSRRSVRRFKPEPVPAPVIERILETATFAPSAHNLQPWRFAVVTTPVVRDRLGQALTEKMQADMTAASVPASEIEMRMERTQRRLREAPVVIVLCRDINAVRANDREEILMSIQSVAGCSLQLLLAAYAEGLGGNWVCWPLYAQKAAREALRLPPNWEPQGIIFLGYADGEPKKKMLKPLREVIRNI